MTPELRLFGGAALIGADGRPITGSAAQPRRLAVLAVLADAWPSPVTRDRLVGLIWPENDDAGARRLLTQSLYALRRELGEFTQVSGRDVGIDAEALRVDLIAFRRALADGDPDRALAEHRGPLMDGFHLRGALEFERWVDGVRDATQRALHDAIESVVRREAAEGRVRDAARWAERLVHAAPFDAGAVVQLMELREREGDVNAALWAAVRYTRRIREELGVEPAPAVRVRAEELRVLVAAVADDDASRVLEPPPARPEPVVRVQGRDLSGERAEDTIAGTAPAADAPAGSAIVAAAGASPAAAADASAVYARALDATASSREPSVGPAPRLAEPASGPGRSPAPWPMPHQRPRRATWLGVGAVAALALAAIPLARSGSFGEFGAPPRHVVTLMPIAARGGAASTEVAGVVRSVLQSALDGSGGMRLRDPSASPGGRVLAVLAPDRRAPQLRVGLTTAGEQLRIQAELRGLPGGTARAVVTGARDSAIALTGRLAMQLTPAFYPELADVVPASIVRRFRSPEALRAYLDGEAAFRRGANAEAYAAFRAATEADSLQPWAWYRRAVAAEQLHRNDEADVALARARALSPASDERERALLDGYARWRVGEARAADSIFRRLVANQLPDREAWFQYAEIAYHAGPLLGRPLGDALDRWRRAVALDSGSVPALVHLIRLEASAGNHARASALLRRAAATGASDIALEEARVIAAYATGDRRKIDAMRPVLDTLPDYSLFFLHATVAGLLERPDLARDFALRLIAPSRPTAMRAEGHFALAHLALATGRWRDAWVELERASRMNPATAAWTRAYFATLPFLTLPDSAVADAARQLLEAPSEPTAAPLYLLLAVDPMAAPTIRWYLESLVDEALRARGLPGTPPSAPARVAEGGACRAESSSRSVASLCADLHRGVLAARAQGRGEAGPALAALESLNLEAPYQFAGRSQFFARSRERWLRADLLERGGRDAEAAEWFAAVPFAARYDYVYLAPSHLHRARILERRGDRSAAADEYRKVVELWRSPDPELAPIQTEAAAGLARVTTPR